MNRTDIEIMKTIPYLDEAEVVVVGAGPAGCAAAITAARMGCRTLVVERYGHAGGAAVNQIVSVVLSQNGADFQGIWHEFMREMKKNGLVSEMVRGEQCDYWLSATYSPESAKHAWDALLTDAGVKILYHGLVTGIEISDHRECRVILETRSGSCYVNARIVIDCTGDGHVCALAGQPFELGDGEGPVSQAATKMFRLVDGVKPELVLNEANTEELRAAYAAAVSRGEFDSPVITSGYLLKYITSRAGKHLPDGTLLLNAVRMIEVDSLNPWSLTRAEIDGRRYAMECARFIRAYVPANERANLLDTSTELGVRASRRILGEAYLTREDVVSLRKFPDGIARGSWEVDVHPPANYFYRQLELLEEYSEFHAKIASGDFYEIPLGCLIPKGSDVLLTAGRCISADVHAQGSLRIQQTCMATGEAAAVLAALSVGRDRNPREIPAEEVIGILDYLRCSQQPAFEILGTVPVLEEAASFGSRLRKKDLGE